MASWTVMGIIGLDLPVLTTVVFPPNEGEEHHEGVLWVLVDASKKRDK
jgi:hypothetical protein